jgi:hypothetical protein
MKIRKTILTAAVLAGLMASLSACGAEETIVASLTTTETSSTATMLAASAPAVTQTDSWGIAQIMVTDPPPADVKSAVVRFNNIEVHKASDNGTTDNESGGEWIQITATAGSFDLMSIIGIEQALGSANLTAGKYTQIRMNVTNVTGTTTDNISYTAEVPSNEVKVTGNFEIGGGNTTTLTLDFDGEKSLVRTGEGKFIFKPVVKLLVNHSSQGEESPNLSNNQEQENQSNGNDKSGN